ncbi:MULTISPECIES: hypothetical protein [unclassified Microbacterium]|uniref:hypothetical protein n=1 Tax=unclassified Microbacterium TaxID=2609290 RepID=UPI00214BDA39|nr:MULTISPECIES: hypothetical protein [unclassified Microbacterium]MCR2784236.1 hypothetical protein [Microbacterium sp. zg.B96]WIM14933.1 hypothetical protein QNO11_10245 [Microbacterium sp. zg-B96]
MTRPLSPAIAVLTATALIVLPPIALVFKLGSAGWVMLALVITAPLWLIGYGVQIAAAVNGYLTPRAVLRERPAALRGLIAAWATSIAVVLVGLFLVDGGDTGPGGSTFMLWTGQAGDRAASELSSGVSSLAAFVWIAGWLWLVVEWIAALVARRRATRAARETAAVA